MRKPLYALLKSETPPTPLVAKYRLDTAYERLRPVIVKEASRKDRRGLGIVRTRKAPRQFDLPGR
jgi:hypothetical protein